MLIAFCGWVETSEQMPGEWDEIIRWISSASSRWAGRMLCNEALRLKSNSFVETSKYLVNECEGSPRRLSDYITPLGSRFFFVRNSRSFRFVAAANRWNSSTFFHGRLANRAPEIQVQVRLDITELISLWNFDYFRAQVGTFLAWLMAGWRGSFSIEIAVGLCMHSCREFNHEGDKMRNLHDLVGCCKSPNVSFPFALWQRRQWLNDSISRVLSFLLVKFESHPRCALHLDTKNIFVYFWTVADLSVSK